MGKDTRYYQLTNNILLEYVYTDIESNTNGDATDRIIDLKNRNSLYKMENKYDDKVYLFFRDDNDDIKTNNNYNNLVVGVNKNDSKTVKVLNETTQYKYDEKNPSQLRTSNVTFDGMDSCDVFFDTCIVHFTGSNYFGDYDSIIFQVQVNAFDGSKISLATIGMKRTDDVEYNTKPLLINQKLYTTHISFKIPSTNFMCSRAGSKFVEKIMPTNETTGEPKFTKLQKNTPIEFNVLGVKATYSTGGFDFMNTDVLNSIQIPFFDSYKKVNVVIEEASDGDYFKIYAQVNNGINRVMSFSDYMYSMDAVPSEYIIMHEISLWENFTDSYNKNKSIKTHTEYYIVNLSANEDDNEIDDIINYRPVCIYANRDVNFTIEDTLRIINTVDNSTIVKRSEKSFSNPNKYGKKIQKIFNDDPPLKVNVFNKRFDEDLDYVRISKSGGTNSASIENHQYNISSLVEVTNIGVSVQQISQTEIEN